ncbi:MAG: 50S ribosomal protein L22 [Cytophagales bacterium]|nr:50S ribosomal protein L22 [Cytophagales bacterium]
MEATAMLRNVPTSPRKMRLIADLIRGMLAVKALTVLKYEPRQGAAQIEKLLLSAIANWQNSNEDAELEEVDLYIKEIRVDGAGMLKRFRPAPQGRAHRIRKRANHVTLVVDSHQKSEKIITNEQEEEIAQKEEQNTQKEQNK